MRIARYDDNRIGLVDGDVIRDASAIADELPQWRWPFPAMDLLIAHLDDIRPRMAELAARASPVPLSSVKLLSPVANPGRIIALGASYVSHVNEALKDPILAQHYTAAEGIKMFFKASPSLVGAGEGVAIRFLEERTDPELELAIVIGRTCDSVSIEEAPSCIVGYTLGLDVTLRGSNSQSARKSIDSYSVLGPWLVTADELHDANNLALRLSVNGELRQDGSTSECLYSTASIVSQLSAYYKLQPGDVILTGTPAGVAPVKPSDVVTAEIEGIGSMTVTMRAYEKAI